MASTKDLKRRIGTVKNTQQTTRAMKVVSAAKLRRAQEAVTNHRPYAKRIMTLIRELSLSMVLGENQFPLLKVTEENLIPKRVLLVIVTSDRGLCGGFNSNVIRASLRWMNEREKSATSVEIAFIGRKGYDFFKTKKVQLSTFFDDLTGKVNFSQAKKIADALTEEFLSGEIDEIKFVYNEFKNAVTQQVVIEDFMPLVLKPSLINDSLEERDKNLSVNYLVKPSQSDVLNELLEDYFTVQCFRILLESQAGEHGARMSAMENATKNAGEMIRKLTLQYNKQRQAGITKELLEIIAGSESQKS